MRAASGRVQDEALMDQDSELLGLKISVPALCEPTDGTPFGGLVTENEADSVTEVPLLGRIPVIGALFQSSDRARTKSRIYAFIRVTMLRDDRFKDLKLLSRSEIERAELVNRDYPPSELQWMH